MKILHRAKAYTLIELLVVISIMGLLLVTGIPAFANYGKSSAFKQKADEVRELIEQTYNLSQNPENASVKAYQVRSDDSTNPQSFYVQSCSAADCASGSNQRVKTVKLLPGESIQKVEQPSPQSAANFIMTCPTDRASKCTDNLSLSSGVATLFRDSNVSLGSAKYTIKLNPFSVKWQAIAN